MNLFAAESKLFTGKPRSYQVEAHDKAFALFKDHRGVLLRMATGTGKTPTCCLLADTWLNRSDNHKVLIVSYEKQLVWQFAQEVYDFLGIEPGIEMEGERADPNGYRVIVASRQSLLVHRPPTPEQIDELAGFGITSLGAVTKLRAEKYLRELRKSDRLKDQILQDIEMFNEQPEANGDKFSRLFKFDWRHNWLVVYDEAHKHSYRMVSVRSLVDWFDQNPESRRVGMTATPKRSDGVSIGHKMFPGIAIDYPLYHPVKRCAVKDGYAVPYIQRYVEVADVDFSSLTKIAGDFDDHELERVLGEERRLAKLVEPLLDMVGERRTLIFCPGVRMAQDVANYINSRRKAVCACGKAKWHPRKLIGDGAACECGRLVELDDVAVNTAQAEAVWGDIDPQTRRDIYERHQSGSFQFLAVCGLCREGYNDPAISCVAVFRPVSEDASSLAEQMKGRACRPLRGLVDGLKTAEERLAAIAASSKPNALIVDLTGITGLPDCASTIEIYAEGEPDEVKKRARQMALAAGASAEISIEDIVQAARDEIAAERERIRLEMEQAEARRKAEAEKRAMAGAKVGYTTHEVGHGGDYDPRAASLPQMRLISFYGMGIGGIELTKRQAGKIITQLKAGKPLEAVAASIGLTQNQWWPEPPSVKQRSFMAHLGIDPDLASSRHAASVLIEAKKDPDGQTAKFIGMISGCMSVAELEEVKQDLRLAIIYLPPEHRQKIYDAGIKRRRLLVGW